MEGQQVRAIYDFSGERDTAELSIKAGEILTVTRDSVGDGWCEGYNSSGKSGLFPAAYVQHVDTKDAISVVTHQDSNDYWDEDWDDESETGQGHSQPTLSVLANTQPYCSSQIAQLPSNYVSTSIDHNSALAIHSVIPERNIPKKNNTFSTLIKSGEENFLDCTKAISVPEEEKIYIEEIDNERCKWLATCESYSCVVTSPKKESKLKGLKCFIAYQLTPTFNSIQVSRRYKHFDWLHERLKEKYCFIAIPPLPDKQIAGRYDLQFIQRRRTQLQEFVHYVCRHPVLSRSRVWEHFMTCTDEKRWKAGKRQAEKDELLGVNYFSAIQCSNTPLDMIKIEIKIDQFSRFLHELDPVVKNFMAITSDQGKKCQMLYKREFQKVGQAFVSLGQALETDDTGNYRMTKALKLTGDVYHDIGKLYEDQPKNDWEPLTDKFHIYRGIIASFPDVISIHKSAVQKKKDCERLISEHKMESQDYHELARRTDIITRALMAEESHFQSERDVQINQTMKNHLTEQIFFYQKIVMKLQEALAAYNA